jgi:hypothetical protein
MEGLRYESVNFGAGKGHKGWALQDLLRPHHPYSQTRTPEPETLNPKDSTRKYQPENINPQKVNLKIFTRKSQSEIRSPAS